MPCFSESLLSQLLIATSQVLLDQLIYRSMNIVSLHLFLYLSLLYIYYVVALVEVVMVYVEFIYYIIRKNVLEYVVDHKEYPVIEQIFCSRIHLKVYLWYRND